MAAIYASERSSVTVIERSSDGGRKILISGGSPDHLLRGMLRAWPLVAQREFFGRDVGISSMKSWCSGDA